MAPGHWDPYGHQNLLIWGRVRTALVPLHVSDSDTRVNKAGENPYDMKAGEATSVVSDPGLKSTP